MKVTVKDKYGTASCEKCLWEGDVSALHWLKETDYAYCPACGSSEFKKLVKKYTVHRDGELEFFGKTYHYTGLKARLLTYSLIAFVVIFGLMPWCVGMYEIIFGWIF